MKVNPSKVIKFIISVLSILVTFLQDDSSDVEDNK